jgi:RNA polymerase-binding transcription factor DksA
VDTVVLNEQELRTCKKQLDDRFHELREEIRLELLESHDQSYIDLAGRVHDLGEASVADLLVDLKLASVDRHIQEIRDIDAALMRIAMSSYGVCADCRSSIAFERLRAYPTAKRCRPCQAKYERLHAGPGRASL